MKSSVCGILLALLFIPLVSSGQKGFGISSRPSWVKPVPYNNFISDTANVSGGYYYLLYDQQINAETQETYVEVAIKVTSDRGLSAASEVNESYDPAYEKLNFNSLYVQRGDRKIDRLSKKDFETIRREESMSRAMYDGSVSVVNNLKDVTKGDIVCYSFTTTGFNPIVNNHFSRVFYVNRGAATGKVSVRIVSSPSRKLSFKWFGDETPIQEGKDGALNTYYIEKQNVGSVIYEDRVPGWYNQYNFVQVTDFRDWTELTNWVTTLYEKPRNFNGVLKQFIDSVKSLASEEEMALVAIKTVQDKVRYLSLSNGLNAMKPHSPSEVFDNKYGDCKDKSFLLSQILNEVGIESHPILVHSERGKSLNERLPAPGDFDHCIVQFKFKDSLYYIDPTITFQRGRLKHLQTPEYYFGVVADVNQPGLITIPTTSLNRSLIRVTEEFDVGAPGEPVRLKVVTVYSGNEADAIRDTQNTSSIAELNQGYRDFYANDYPDIKLNKSISFKDDPLKNEMTVTEEYSIPDFWIYNSNGSIHYAKLRASVLASYISRPSSKSRHTPFTLRYPLDVEELIIVKIPETYSIEKISDNIRGPGFYFSSTSAYYDNALRLQYSLDNSAPFVDAADTREYLNKINEIYDHIGYQFTNSSKQLTTSKQSGNTVQLILTGVFLLACFFIGRMLYQYDPEPAENAGGYHEFNVPLMLAIVGLSITPIKILIAMAEGTYFADSFGVFTDMNVSIPLAIYTIVSLAISIGISSLAILTFIIAWNRRTSATLFMMVFYAVNFAGIGLMILIGRLFFEIHPEPSDVRNLTIALIMAAIWIPYLRTSIRAKGTFRKRLRS